MTAYIDLITGIAITLIGGLSLAGIIYIIKLQLKIIKHDELYNRIFFGEAGVDNWRGIVNMCIENTEEQHKMKELVRSLMLKLIDKKIIDKDDQLVVLAFDDFKSSS
jgi:hypothetical protein